MSRVSSPCQTSFVLARGRTSTNAFPRVRRGSCGPLLALPEGTTPPPGVRDVGRARRLLVPPATAVLGLALAVRGSISPLARPVNDRRDSASFKRLNAAGTAASLRLRHASRVPFANRAAPRVRTRSAWRIEPRGHAGGAKALPGRIVNKERAARLIASAVRGREAVQSPSRSPMNHTREYKPADDHVRTALEVSCAVLMTLELIRTRVGDAGAEAASVRALLERATESLREVTAELRMASSQRAL